MAIKSYTRGSGQQLSPNFRADEFACTGKTCCNIFKVDEKLVTFLQQIREHFAVPVSITSGYRCAKRNKAVGGTSGSQHLKGKAADIIVKGVKPAEVAAFAESIGILGIGLYDSFVHIDTRSRKSFWQGHQQQKRSTFLLPQLKKGSKGAAVKALQQFLNALDFSCGKADGIWGSKTQAAMEAFEMAGGWETLTGKEH